MLDYPASWVAHYTPQAYVLRDSVVAWALSEIGSVRWSAITLPDTLDMLGQAGAHGLVYGATVSTGPLDARTIGSLARSDLELTDEELARAEVLITELHQRLMPSRPLTLVQVEALRLIAKGYRYADAAKAFADFAKRIEGTDHRCASPPACPNHRGGHPTSCIL